MNVRIYRVAFGETETVGVLLVDLKPVCWTLELPWRNNLPNISCIPEGQYVAKREWSGHFHGNFWHLQDVPGRSDIILGHVGNSWEDTEGCTILGVDVDKGPLGITVLRGSKIACDRWEAMTAGQKQLSVEIRI